MKKKETNKINWDLLAKDVTGELGPDEHEQLHKSLEANPDIEKQVMQLWGDARYAQELKTIDSDKGWDKVKGQLQHGNSNKQIKLKRYIAMVASVIVLLASILVFRLVLNSNDSVTVNSAQNIEHIILPDGSGVHLNYESSLVYPNKFASKERRVKLDGGAYFDVVRNEKQPFIIETEFINISVLGTSFNVEVYDYKNNSVVTVSSGSVRVASKNINKNVVLEAGDAAIYDNNLHSFETKKVTTGNYKAWKSKEIEFVNTNILEVFETIESAYHIEIDLDSSIKTEEMVLSATFSNYSLEHVLGSVCKSFNLDYYKEEDRFIISE